MLRGYAWHRWILKYPPIQELHDIEIRLNDTGVLTKTVCFRHWNISLLKRVYYSVLSVDLVRSLRKQLPRRLLSHDKLLASIVGEEVRWVRLAISELHGKYKLWLHFDTPVSAYLLYVERNSDVGDVGGYVALE